MTTETFDKAKEEVLKKVENIHHIYAPLPRANKGVVYMNPTHQTICPYGLVRTTSP